MKLRETLRSDAVLDPGTNAVDQKYGIKEITNIQLIVFYEKVNMV